MKRMKRRKFLKLKAGKIEKSFSRAEVELYILDRKAPKQFADITLPFTAEKERISVA